jgi:hypothetical protein
MPPLPYVTSEPDSSGVDGPGTSEMAGRGKGGPNQKRPPLTRDGGLEPLTAAPDKGRRS